MDINNVKGIQETVRKKYAEVSQSAKGKFAYPTGKAGVEALGYDFSIVKNIPDKLLESFCGVGNPFSLGKINQGEVVLDVGCGAGFDMAIAHHLAGPEGRICGIDLTPEMVELAQKNLVSAGISNAEVRLACSETILYADSTFDVVISNGVLNLSPLKEKSFGEIYRVLKPDGRFQFADIVLQGDQPPASACSIDSWSQ